MAVTAGLEIKMKGAAPTSRAPSSTPAHVGMSAVVRHLEVQRCVDAIAEQLQRAAFYRASLHGECPAFKTLLPAVQETFKRIARQSIARTSSVSHREAEGFAERTCSTSKHSITADIAAADLAFDAIRAYHEELDRQFSRHPISSAGEVN